MIIINADGLQDGLYNVKGGQIFKYKAKGGTVRTYEMGEIVRCENCIFYEKALSAQGFCHSHESIVYVNDYCSYGERREP